MRNRKVSEKREKAADENPGTGRGQQTAWRGRSIQCKVEEGSRKCPFHR